MRASRPDSLDFAVVLHYEEPEAIDRFASSLVAAWPRKLDGRLYVVDNASTNGIADYAHELLSRTLPDVPLELLRPGRNLGFARAVNRVLERSDAEYLAVFNPDGAFEPETLRALVRALRDHPLAVQATAELRPFGSEPPGAPGPPAEREWCPGGATVYRQELFAALGGFDPLFFLWGEDVDLGTRAHASGMRSLSVPGAVFYHEIRDPSRRRELSRYRLHAKHELAWKHIHFGGRAAATWFLHVHRWAIRNVLIGNRRPVGAFGALLGAWHYLALVPACRDRRGRPWSAERVHDER